MRHNLVWLMATWHAAANLYYNQPLLAAIAQSLMPQRSRVHPNTDPIGYAAVGIFCLFPWVT